MRLVPTPSRLAIGVSLLTSITFPNASLAGETVEIGERISLRSEVLDEVRTLLIHLPESYATSDFSYPVLYLLDGDSDFRHTVGITDFLGGTGQTPELIVVGIPNTVRSRDLTPESDNDEETAFWPAVGGADRFRVFLRDELIPFIDDRYRTEEYRIIRGQSFGGLFAIHDYMSDDPIFDAALTSSPAVGWNFGTLIERTPVFFSGGIPRPLYVAAAGRDFPENLASVRRFVERVDAAAANGDSWRADVFEDESHYSLSHLATYRALTFLYDGWSVPDSVIARADYAACEHHYERLSARYGYSIHVPLRSIVQFGNQLLREKRFDEGIRVLGQAIDLYPNQPESHWHVGDAYILSGRPQDARPFFETAVRKARERDAPDLADYEASLADLETTLSTPAR